MNLTITFGELFAYIEEFTNEQFQDDVERNISHLGVSVPTPNGAAPVRWAIKKFNLPVVDLTFADGRTLSCSTHHILVDDLGFDVLVSNLKVGSVVQTQDGYARIVDIVDAGAEDCFDIGIPFPHRYYDANGLLHHNTIITGALSKLCEQFGRTIIIVPSKSLVTQTEVDYRNIGLDVGVYYGDRKELGKTHTISTWQSLSSLCKKSDGDFTIGDMIEDVVAVVVDECFSGETPVLTPNGWRQIKDIETGDEVVNYNEDSGVFKTDIVVSRHENLTTSQSESMYEMVMDNGSVLRVTGNHKFLTDSGWKRADELTEFDDIVSYG